MISIQTKFPDLAKEWSPNNRIKPSEVSYGSQKKVLWICPKGHEYEMSPNSRTNNSSNCPYCSNQKVLAGYNDLATTRPDLLTQWSPNNIIKPTEVTKSSSKKVLWVCSLSHEYKMAPHSKSKGKGCSYCAGNKVLIGFNDLASTHPELAKQWSKKNTIKPTEVTFGSRKKIWWICSLGHEWESGINGRASVGYGCPYCSNKKVLKGFNDFETTHPKLAQEWSPNNKLKPCDVTFGKNKKFIWNCKNGHEFYSTISHRVTSNSNCPYCAGQLLKGFNDFASKYPELLDQWSDKNITKPTEITSKNPKKIWRKCPAGKHEDWQQVLSDWTRYGCPLCAKSKQGCRISISEQKLAYFIENLGYKINQSRRDLLRGLEIDIYIPDLKIGIEFNGTYWHTLSKCIERDERKKKLCAEKGIRLLVVTEESWVSDPDSTREKITWWLKSDSIYAKI